jgi:hypothetical protein
MMDVFRKVIGEEKGRALDVCASILIAMGNGFFYFIARCLYEVGVCAFLFRLERGLVRIKYPDHERIINDQFTRG